MMNCKKILSLIISVLLLLTAVSPALFAHAADSVSVTFLFADGTQIVPFFDLQVADGTAEAYGIAAAEIDHTGKKVESVTALDALVAAHAALYGDAFTAQTAENYLVVSYGYASKAFTQIADFGFALNDKTPNDGVLVTSSWGSYYTGYALDTTCLQNGDVVTLYKYADTKTWSDLYATFDQKALTVTTGRTFSVSASGYGVMMYGCCEQSVIDANTVPMAGASLYLTQDFKTYTPAGTLDASGASSVTVKNAGIWYLVICGSVNGSPVISNICKLTLARWIPVGLRSVVRLENHILTLGFTIQLRDMNKNAEDCRRTYGIQFCFDGTQAPVRFLREL